jgi:membrane associated rhomboid family serine protease/Zn-finger nucleic acid-binding protein
MSVCPKCNKRLTRTKTEAGCLFLCTQCNGRAVALSVLRKTMPPNYASALWMGAKRRMADRGQRCPICRKAMTEVQLPTDGRSVPLDICTGCQFVWFDPQEFEQFPKQPPKTKKAEREQLPEKVREAMAIAELKLDETRRLARDSSSGDFGSGPPVDDWKHLPAILGMPVEYDGNPIRQLPWATWGLAAIMAIVYLLTFGNLGNVIEQFGLVPAQPLRHGGITFLTSFFLHAGLLHLIGNAYFLLIFGDNVEDQLGPWRFLWLVAAAALAGDLLHILADPRAVVPCVGASGGISGLIVFYALKFPRARLGFMMRYWYVFRWVHVPAWSACIIWFLLQLMLAKDQLAGVGNVSALAHLGGAALGAFAWWLWRNDVRIVAEETPAA